MFASMATKKLFCKFIDINMFKKSKKQSSITHDLHIWRSPNLNELTPIISNMELTYLGSEASISTKLSPLKLQNFLGIVLQFHRKRSLIFLFFELFWQNLLADRR